VPRVVPRSCPSRARLQKTLLCTPIPGPLTSQSCGCGGHGVGLWILNLGLLLLPLHRYKVQFHWLFGVIVPLHKPRAATLSATGKPGATLLGGATEAARRVDFRLRTSLLADHDDQGSCIALRAVRRPGIERGKYLTCAGRGKSSPAT